MMGINKRELTKIISQMSTLSSVDTFVAVEALTTIITDLVQESRIVKTEELGSFKMTFKTVGDVDSSKITKNNIKERRIVFIPTKSLRKQLNATQVVKE